VIRHDPDGGPLAITAIIVLLLLSCEKGKILKPLFVSADGYVNAEMLLAKLNELICFTLAFI
jgi:hypothetical protein